MLLVPSFLSFITVKNFEAWRNCFSSYFPQIKAKTVAGTNLGWKVATAWHCCVLPWLGFTWGLCPQMFDASLVSRHVAEFLVFGTTSVKFWGSSTNVTSLLLQGGPWDNPAGLGVKMHVQGWPSPLHNPAWVETRAIIVCMYMCSTQIIHISIYICLCQIFLSHSKACQKNPHWTHSELQISPAHVGWEPGTLPKGKHTVVAVGFPSAFASVLCSQVRSLVSYSVFHCCVHSRSPAQGWQTPHAHCKRNPTGQQHMVNQTPEDALDWGDTIVRTTKNK